MMNLPVESLRPGDVINDRYTVIASPVDNGQNGITVTVENPEGDELTISAMRGDERNVTYLSATDSFTALVA